MPGDEEYFFNPEFIGEYVELALSGGDASFLARALDEFPEEIARSAAVVCAAKSNNTEALSLLIERGFSIGPVCPRREGGEKELWYSPIGEAAENLAFDALEILAAAGADVNETAEGQTWPWPPLMRVIRDVNNGNLAQSCKMITRLVELGADVNAVVYWPADEKNYTALSFVQECIAQKKVRERLSALLEGYGARRCERPIKPKFRREF